MKQKILWAALAAAFIPLGAAAQTTNNDSNANSSSGAVSGSNSTSYGNVGNSTTNVIAPSSNPTATSTSSSSTSSRSDASNAGNSQTINFTTTTPPVQTVNTNVSGSTTQNQVISGGTNSTLTTNGTQTVNQNLSGTTTQNQVLSGGTNSTLTTNGTQTVNSNVSGTTTSNVNTSGTTTQNMNYHADGTTTQNVNSTSTIGGTQTFNNVQSGRTEQYIEYGGSYTIKNVPSVNGPPLTTANDTCMGSSSGSVNVPGLGIGLGSTWTDRNCVMLKNAREMWNMGMKAAAMALMCTDANNRAALEITGFVCPQTEAAQRSASLKNEEQQIAAERRAVAAERQLALERESLEHDRKALAEVMAKLGGPLAARADAPSVPPNPEVVHARPVLVEGKASTATVAEPAKLESKLESTPANDAHVEITPVVMHTVEEHPSMERLEVVKDPRPATTSDSLVVRRVDGK